MKKARAMGPGSSLGLAHETAQTGRRRAYTNWNAKRTILTIGRRSNFALLSAFK
jgi:hypothetical protein